MMTSQSDRQVEKVEQMAGGKGHVLIERLLNAEQLDGKCGMYAHVTLEPGCTLGVHGHTGETETYYLLSRAKACIMTMTSPTPVKAGDVTSARTAARTAWTTLATAT